MAVGTLKWFNPDKGEGLVQEDGGSELPFSAGSLSPGDLASLEEGSRVRFETVQGSNGPMAQNVTRV